MAFFGAMAHLLIFSFFLLSHVFFSSLSYSESPKKG
jgi:hypothetical protein